MTLSHEELLALIQSLEQRVTALENRKLSAGLRAAEQAHTLYGPGPRPLVPLTEFPIPKGYTLLGSDEESE